MFTPDVRNLDALKESDPMEWELEVRLRRVDRILATSPSNSYEHRIARLEADRLRPLVRGY
jgi:hypothetical protein